MSDRKYPWDHLPPEIWNGVDFTCIHAAIIVGRLENSALLASTLRANEYQRLINAFQRSMLNLVWELEDKEMNIREYTVAGDQVQILLYDPQEVVRNYRLDGLDPIRGDEREEMIEEARRGNQDLMFNGLKTAILVKNQWLAQNVNLTRVYNRQPPHGIRIGLHSGRVHLCNRADGKRRAEGFSINVAQHIESAAGQGIYSKIMLSKDAHDRLRGTIRKHTMLRQRVFFHEHQWDPVMPEDIVKFRTLHELKFYSRIGIETSADAVKQYETLLTFDSSNIWAYYQLFEYYAYVEKDWDKVGQLAMKIHNQFPHDEKILLDLSRYYYNISVLDQAQRYADRAIELNSEFDLVYEHLAVLAETRKDNLAQVQYLSRALSLAPGSPVIHMNLGFAMCKSGQFDEGAFHILEAMKKYPQYVEHPGILKNFNAMHEMGQVPEKVAMVLTELGCEFN